MPIMKNDLDQVSLKSEKGSVFCFDLPRRSSFETL